MVIYIYKGTTHRTLVTILEMFMLSLNLLVVTMFIFGPMDWLTLLVGVNFVVELSLICLDDRYGYPHGMYLNHHEDEIYTNDYDYDDEMSFAPSSGVGSTYPG